MKLTAVLLVSVASLSGYQPTWIFEDDGLSAFLQEPELRASPLRLACAQQGYLQIDILSGPKPEVTLVGRSRIALTIRGDLKSSGHIISTVNFRSITAEFLREEGDVEVIGERSYQLHLHGARRVLQTLESSCMAVS